MADSLDDDLDTELRDQQPPVFGRGRIQVRPRLLNEEQQADQTVKILLSGAIRSSYLDFNQLVGKNKTPFDSQVTLF